MKSHEPQIKSSKLWSIHFLILDLAQVRILFHKTSFFYMSPSIDWESGLGFEGSNAVQIGLTANLNTTSKN